MTQYENYILEMTKLLQQSKEDKDFSDNASKALKHYIKKFIVYALDVNEIKTTDIDEESLNMLVNKLKIGKFMTKRKKLRGLAVDKGLSAIVFSIVKGKVFFDVYNVMKPFTEVADKITNIYVYQDNDLINTGEQAKQIYYNFKTTDGKTVKTQLAGDINGRPDSFQLTSNKTSEYEVMPVIVLPNNEDYEGTFEYTEQIIEAAGKHLNNINKEWEYDKSMLINNNMFNPERDADSLQNEIEGGEKKVFDDKDPNGLGGSSIQYISSGGVSSQVAQRNYDKFKQEALFYTLSWLVVSDGKTNKHGAEVITSQLPTFNHIQYQVELLKEFYSHFVFVLHNLMVDTKELQSEKLEMLPNIDIELSKYMEAIVDMGNSDGKNNAAAVANKE